MLTRPHIYIDMQIHLKHCSIIRSSFGSGITFLMRFHEVDAPVISTKAQRTFFFYIANT